MHNFPQKSSQKGIYLSIVMESRVASHNNVETHLIDHNELLIDIQLLTTCKQAH
jgi:hypothetical protein